MNQSNDLDIIIPVSIELDHPTRASVVSEVRELKSKYGFTRAALSAPCGGWRSVGYPPSEKFVELAAFFAEIKAELEPDGIECGWWITSTLKSGTSEDFSPMVRADGSRHDFANCPLDPEFRRRFADDIAAFLKIAKPVFAITEDDFSIFAAGGCFCEHHIAEFSRRMEREYTRREIVTELSKRTPEAIPFAKVWRKLICDSQVGLAAAIREAADIDSPEVPIGYMQAGGADQDGDCTEAIARALAGERHVPFSRL